jgi:hypothetical protein
MFVSLYLETPEHGDLHVQRKSKLLPQLRRKDDDLCENVNITDQSKCSDFPAGSLAEQCV